MEYISFESKIVETKAKSELKKMPDSESYFVKVGRRNFITQEGAQKITKMRIYSSDFTNNDLDDLKYFVNLKLLDIRSFGLTDLQNAPSLEKLESISLSIGDNVLDLTDLEKFQNLRSVDMGDVINPQALSGLKKLRTVDLYKIGTNDLSCLKELKFLTHLRLGGNKIEDLSPLEDLKKLKELRLNGNRISDLYPLRELKNLKILSLHGNRIGDISPLTELVSLEKLYLGTNNIRDISALSHCKNLRTIEIFGNSLSSIEPLMNLELLESIATDTGDIYKPLASKFDMHTGVRSEGSCLNESEFLGFIRQKKLINNK
jgi:Leucine-rich repeat (LRR) protein